MENCRSSLNPRFGAGSCFLYYLCPGLDLNQHGIAPISPSRIHVYQFHHLGKASLLCRKSVAPSSKTTRFVWVVLRFLFFFFRFLFPSFLFLHLGSFAFHLLCFFFFPFFSLILLCLRCCFRISRLLLFLFLHFSIRAS